MKNCPEKYPTGVANDSDYRAGLSVVSICFADPTINHLFSELLESRGIKTQIVEADLLGSSQTKIITEPQFFPNIETSQQRECLIVGNKDALKGLDGIALSRPLTEEKIEAALAQFLR